MLLGIKWPEMQIKTTSSIFSNISMHHKYQNEWTYDLAGYFGATVKFSLVPGFRDVLTFGDLINILICKMIVWMNRVLKNKHIKGYFVVLWLILPKIQWFMFPLPLNFGSNRASMGVAYDVIFSVIAGLPKVYPNLFDVQHGVLQ